MPTGHFFEQILPHLKPGHLLALLPGNLGALAVASALREEGIDGVIVAESDTAPYVCRKSAPDRAVIWGTVTGPGIGVEPASQTDEAMPALRALFPGAVSYGSALEAGLSALNPGLRSARGANECRGASSAVAGSSGSMKKASRRPW